MKTFDVFSHSTVVMQNHHRVEAATKEEAEKLVLEGEGIPVSEECVDFVGDTEIIEDETEEETA